MRSNKRTKETIKQWLNVSAKPETRDRIWREVLFVQEQSRKTGSALVRLAEVPVKWGSAEFVESQTPDVAINADGRFVVAYRLESPESGLFARVYELWASPRTGEISVADPGRRVEAAIGADGGFVVVWDDLDGYVKAQMYDGDGNPRTAAFPVNTSVLVGSTTPVVAMDGDGRFVVA